MSTSELITYLILALVAMTGLVLNSNKHKEHRKVQPRQPDPIPETTPRYSAAHAKVEEKPAERPVTPVSQDCSETSISQKSVTEAAPMLRTVRVDKDIKEIRDHFSLKRAIIYKEILEPKYKEY